MSYFSDDNGSQDFIHRDNILSKIEFDSFPFHIRSQVSHLDERSGSLTNFFAALRGNYEEAKADADPDECTELDALFEKQCHEIIDVIGVSFDFDIAIEDKSFNEVVTLTEMLYQFFVLDIHENIISFFAKYITKYKRQIARDLKGTINFSSKSVMVVSAKKKNKNKVDALIIGNLLGVIRYVSKEEFEPEDFLKYIADNSTTNGYVANLFSSMNLSVESGGKLYETFVSLLSETKILTDVHYVLSSDVEKIDITLEDE